MDEPIRVAGPEPAVPGAVAQRPTPPPGAIFRQDVAATVEQGLGYFLQRVSVDPELSGGKFKGFRIVELRPTEYWQGVDLKPGDVITQVNGMPIERDIDAYQAFQALRGAPALRVAFVRSGVKRELVYSIVDRDAKSDKKPVQTAPAPAAAPKAPPGKRSAGRGPTGDLGASI